jgi:hypothetical protein
MLSLDDKRWQELAGVYGAVRVRARRDAIRGNRGDAGNPGGQRKSEGSSRKIEADANQAGMAGDRSRRRSKTREVVTDLLPIYFSGEASGDTKVLIEDYFRQDPDFERIARNAATPLETLRAPRPSQPAQKRRNATWRASFGDCDGASGCSARAYS